MSNAATPTFSQALPSQAVRIATGRTCDAFRSESSGGRVAWFVVERDGAVEQFGTRIEALAHISWRDGQAVSS